jgi:hypothetical protein
MPGALGGPVGDFPRSRYPRYANEGRTACSAPFVSVFFPAPMGFLCSRVGDARLLWFEARVGVYLTERPEEFVVSEVTLSRRVRTGIFEAGDGRTGIREVCAREVSPVNVELALLPDRSCWCEPYVVVGKREPPADAPMTASTPGTSSSVPSNVGIPNPGDATSCPLTTSPKNGCRPLDAGLDVARLAGEVICFRVGDMWWSRLLLLPVVRRVAGAFLGVAGAGCGRSLGFRLLNLYVP